MEDFSSLDRFGMDFDGVDWWGGEGSALEATGGPVDGGPEFIETVGAVSPGSFADTSAYNPSAAGLIGDPKPKKLQETAGEHAPKGGVSLAGKQFRGGEFIPGSAIDRATPQERKALKQKQEAAKTAKESPKPSEPRARKEPPEPASRAGLGPEDLLAKFHKSGGFSYQPAMKDSPTTGYSVSYNQEHEKVIPGHGLTTGEIQGYMDQNKDVFEKDPTAHFGAWYDAEADKVYLDVAHVIQDRDEAVRLGREHNQEAIYDLGKQETVFVKQANERRIDAKESGPGYEAGVPEGRDSSPNPRGHPKTAPPGGARQVTEAAPPDLRAAISVAERLGHSVIVGPDQSQSIVFVAIHAKERTS